jgi:hypothetical protein
MCDRTCCCETLHDYAISRGNCLPWPSWVILSGKEQSPDVTPAGVLTMGADGGHDGKIIAVQASRPFLPGPMRAIADRDGAPTAMRVVWLRGLAPAFVVPANVSLA